MAGPGGVEVGRASIKVLPDLSQFFVALEKFVQRIERQVVVQIPATLDTRGVAASTEKIREQVQNMPAPRIPVLPETDEFARRTMAQVKTAVAAIEADIPLTADGERLRRDVEVKVAALRTELHDLSIKVPVDAEQAANMRASVAAKVAELQALVKANPVEVPVKPDLDDFGRRALADARKAAAAIELQVPLTADGERLRRDVSARVAALKAQIEHLSLNIPLDVGEAAAARAQIAAKVAELQAMVRADPVEIPVNANVRELSAVRAVLAGIRLPNLPNLAGLAGLSTAFARIGLQGAGIAALGMTAAAAVPQMLSLAGSITNLAGVAGLLPAAGLAGAGAIGALALGVHGFGDAIKNMGDPKKFAESLETLAPNAREAALAIKGLAPEFKSLQQVVQQNLFAGVSVSLREMVSSLLPQVRTGLGGIATALGGTIRGVMATLSGLGGENLLGGILDNTGVAIKALSPGLNALVQAFVRMGAVGSGFLQPLAAGFSSLATQFGDFITRVTSDGSFAAWIQTGLTALRQVATIGLEAGRAILGIVNAAQSAGGGGLATLADLMTLIADVINSPAFQQGLAAFFSGVISGAGALMSSALPAIGTLLAGLGPIIGQLVQQLGPLLGAAIADLAPVLGHLLAVLGPAFVDVLMALLPAVVTLAQALGPVLADAISALLPVVTTLIGALGPAFTTILTSLIPLVVTLAQQLGPILGVAAQTLAQVFAALAPSLAPVIVALGQLAVQVLPLLAPLIVLLASTLATLLPTLTPLIGLIAQGLVAALTFLVPLITRVVTAFSGWLTSSDGATAALAPVADFLATTFVPALQSIRTALQQVAAFVVPVVMQIVSVIVANWPMIAQIFQQVAQVIASVMTNVGAVISMAVTAAMAIWDVFGGTIMGVIQAVFPAMLGIISGVLNVIQGVFNAFTALIHGDWSGLWDAVQQILSGAMGILSSIMSGALGALGAIASSAWDAIKGAFSAGVDGAVGFVQSLPGRALGALGDIGSLLYNAGANLIKGLADGMLSAVKSVISAAGDIASTIRGFFPGSPIETGPLTSWNNGGAGQRLVRSGLIDGMLSQSSAVASASRSIASAAAKGAGAVHVAGAGGPSAGVAAAEGPQQVFNGDIVAHDYNDFVSQMQRRARLGQLGVSAT